MTLLEKVGEPALGSTSPLGAAQTVAARPRREARSSNIVEVIEFTVHYVV